MASSYTDLGIEKMATGENAGTWGTKTNTNLEIIEKSIAGYVEQAVTSGGTTALSITDGDATESTSVARHAVIKLTGTITGNSIVTVPDSVEKVYIVTNGTSGAYTVQFKTASGTGITFGVSEKTTRLVYSDGTNLVDAGFGGSLDVEGRELVLDADGDTSITADTDDQIDIKIAGADDFQFTANTFTAQSGSTIAAQALTATTVTASGIVKTDDTTEATSTTDGSLQTDGGLSVAKDAVIGDDLKLLSDSAVLSFGADSDITVTHAADTGLTTNGTFQATTITATTAFVPDASDGAALGTSALEFSDLFLADGAVVNFGDDQEIKLTHVADTGLTLKHTATADDKPVSLTLQTGETDIAANDVIGKIDFQAPDEGTGTDAILVAAGIEAVSEGDFSSSSNATKLSFKTGASEAASEKMSLSSGGNLTISGDLTVSGDDITMGTNTAGNLLIADGTNFNSVAAGSLSEISTVANDDVFIAVDTSGGGLKKIARSAIVAGLATSGAISNVVEDTSPQLGGNLDMNGQDIVTTSNANLELAPDGTGTVVIKGNDNQAALVLNCENNSHGQKIQPQPHSVGSSAVHTLPNITGDLIAGKIQGTNFTNSLLVGHATSGTLDAAEKNTGVGIAALDALTSADFNTAVGYQAGSALTTGTKNTFIGAEVGDGVSTKYQNTGVGYHALSSGSFDGHSNTALGVNAGEAVTTGNKNVFLGWSSGNNVTSGDGNVVIGNADVASATGDDQLSISDGEDGSVVWITGDSSANLTTTGDVTLANTKKVIFGDAAENIVGDGTDLTIASSNDLHLTATTDINIPANVGMTFGDDGEKIEGNGTDLTIASSNDLHLTATTDINIPANVGLTFGDDGEKIEGDGTDLTIAVSNDILVDATRNIILDADNNGQITFRDGGTQYLKTIHASAEVRIQSSISDSDILLQGNDGGATITALKLDMSAAGQAQFKDGTAALPILSNDGDTDTGLFFSAADTMAFSAGGTSQFTMADGVIAPVTDNDVDLGTSSLEFKDGYFDGTLHCDVLDLAGTEITSISSGISTGTAIAMAIVFG